MVVRRIGWGIMLATVVAAVGYTVAWFQVASTTAENLQTMLQAKADSQLSNLAVSSEGFPGKMTFRVVGFVQGFVHPKNGQKTLVVSEKPLIFSTYLWQPYKVVGDLTQAQFALQTTSVEGKAPRLAKVSIGRGDVTYNFLKNNIKTNLNQLVVAPEFGPTSQIENLIFKQQAAEEKTGLVDATMSLAIQNFEIIKAAGAQPEKRFELMLFEGGVENFPRFMAYHGGDGDEADAAQKVLNARVRDLAANNSRFFMSNFLLTKGELQLAASGETRLDDQLRPEGSLTLKVNNFSAAIAEVVGENQNESPFLTMLKNFAGKNEVNIVLTAKEGALKVNDFPLGVVLPLPDILQKMVRYRQENGSVFRKITPAESDGHPAESSPETAQ